MTFDPQAATAVAIDALGPQALARAAAYTAGSEALQLVDLLVAGLVSWLAVRSGLLERVAARLARRGPALRALAAGLLFFFASAVLELPWSLYRQWWREGSYGRSSQPLADFLVQGAAGALITTLLASLFIVGVYALIRRTGRRWWLWSGALTAAATASMLLLAPVLIEPIFNDYQPLPAGPVRDALTAMAQQAGVPAERIFVYDGSRQSNNFTANVSGLGGSARIAISDVAFKGASLDEVKAVTGHEIGHYVLGHVWRGVALSAALSVLLFFAADRLFPRFARAFGSRARIDQPAGLPVLVFMVSLFATLAQPAFNALSRLEEAEADRYSLATVGLPDALASALVKTAAYRDPRPHRLQELIFYTHPSVERRVRAAMTWKALHRPPPVTAAPPG